MSEKVDKKAQEELNKLEEEAYFELCQIIAEAIQLQNIQILNSRLSQWKTKYKKLLDGSTPNSALIQKIKALQSDQYIGYIIDLILSQIRIKEYKRIENQSKALKKLYVMIKNTKDLKTLKSKVAEWKKEYPIESFLKMYQKKIKSYTSTSNLEDNAFDQDKAFSDLVDITKMNGTFDELQEEVLNWEKKYSINDRYELDDFIKNKKEVKLYTSSEYLRSISNDKNDENPDIIEIPEESSSLAKQAAAYNALVSIAVRPNNIEKIFEWVYKNNGIQFNDKYKELILAATYLDYSPTYLKKLKLPDFNLSTSSLSFEEYSNIDVIKRYAVISYFNLLLPPERRIPNDYFKKHLREVYYKSEQVKHTSNIPVSEDQLYFGTLDPSNSDLESQVEVLEPEVNEITDSTVTVTSPINNSEDLLENPTLEIDLKEEKEKEEKPQEFTTSTVEVDTPIDNSEDLLENPTLEIDLKEEKETEEKPQEFTISTVEVDTPIDNSEDLLENPTLEIDLKKEKEEKPQEFTASTVEVDSPIDNSEDLLENPTLEIDLKEKKEEEPQTFTTSTVEIDSSIDNSEEVKKDPLSEPSKNKNENIDIIDFTPLFFAAVHSYSVQAALIDEVDNSVTKYTNRPYPKKEIDLDIQKNNMN